jgi:hypothetical protein
VANRNFIWLELRSLLNTYTFIICFFVVVLVAVILAFLLNASVEIAAAILALGSVTALLESRTRAKGSFGT